MQRLLILREDAKVGQPFAEYLGRTGSDVVYDLEITPNRPDLNSVIGIAREIAAVTGNALKMPQVEARIPHPASRIPHPVTVRLEDPDLCPRYTARLIRGVKIGRSPDWLKYTLEKVGIRSISNVVDVTNYVMLETGQPLHAFDYRLLQSGAGADHPSPITIVVRRASEGEQFMTLDGQQRKLTSQMLLIANETKPLALAGIMGGQNSEITLNTTDVLIESAYFKPQNIRATSRKLELRTESSYRFERGGDIGICDWASRRAAQLILETAGGELLEGIVDAFPKPYQAKQVTLRHAQTNAVLGIEIPARHQINSLERLGLEVVAVNALQDPGHSTTFGIPSFRVDLKREIDLIEEAARLYGVEKIPATPPRGAVGASTYDPVHDQIAEARRLLTGLGLHEAQGQTLLSDLAIKPFLSEPPIGLVYLSNPLSSDMNVLRPSLLPGLLEALRHNLAHKNNDIALFEIGRVFMVGQASVLATVEQASVLAPPSEPRRLAMALTGQRHPLFWSGSERDAKFDLYDLKGRLEDFFEQFGLRGITWSRRSESTPLFLESATIHLGKVQLGELGQLLPTLARQYDLRDAVLLAELNLDFLLTRRNPVRAFKPLPIFPSIRRDIAMVVPEVTTHEAVLQTIRQAKPPNLESIDLFDIFRGKSIPPGQKTMAYAFIYRSPERTLTDAEINAAHQKVLAQIKQALGAVIRE